MNNPSNIIILDNKGNTKHQLTFTILDENKVPLLLCYDDTIQTIKYKIIKGLQTLEDYNEINYEELYLFSVIERNFDTFQWYQDITLQDTIPLTKPRIKQWFKTLILEQPDIVTVEEMFGSYEMKSANAKKKWSYEEILKFPFFSQNRIIKQKKPIGIRTQSSILGKRTEILKNNESYCANPIDLDSSLITESVMETNRSIPKDDELLIQYGTVDEGTIYVVCARDILQKSSKLSKPLVYLYYPYLFERNIINLPQLENEMDTLREQTIKHLSRLEKTFHNMDILYGVFHDRQDQLVYTEHGVEHFSIGLESEQTLLSLNANLETIFQNIHAKEHIPFILFYRSSEDINVRLYSNSSTVNGKKIPYMHPKIIESLTKYNISKKMRKSYIALYIQDQRPINNRKDYIEVILYQDGTIHFEGKCKQPMVKNEFDAWFVKFANTLLQDFQWFLTKVGYEIVQLTSLYDSFVRIYNLEYRIGFLTNKKIDLTDYSCLRFLFDEERISTYSNKTGKNYRYKRIEHYQELNESEEYISNLLRIDPNTKTLHSRLRLVYQDRSNQELHSMIVSYMSKYRGIHGVSTKRKMRTYMSSGFPVNLTQSSFDNRCLITIQKIDKMWYLDFIQVYMESIIRLLRGENIPEKWMSIWNNDIMTESEFVPMKQLHSSTVDDNDNVMENDVEEDDNDEDDEDDENEQANQFLEKNEKEEEDVEENNKDDDDDDDDDDILQYESSSDEESDDGDEEENQKEETKVEKENKEEDDEMWGGTPQRKKRIRSNSKVPHFENRMIERYPLFEQTMKNYNKKCFNIEHQKRQPVILTKKEKEEMEKKFKNSSVEPYNQEQILEFGEDKNKDSLYYICPKFWCSKPGQEGVLTKEEVDQGVCGKIITDPSNPKEDEHVFYRGEEENGETKFQYPNFMKSKDTPCIPCCFKVSGNKQMETRKQCNSKAYGDAKTEYDDPDELIKKNQKDLFVLNMETKNRAMLEGRLALLPVVVQSMMKIDYRKCLELNSKLKNKCHVYLRKGVEMSKNQTFLSCIAVAWNSEQNAEVIVRVKDFKKVLIESITLDLFVRAQNAVLVSRFTPKKPTMVNIKDYRNSVLYKNLDLQQETQEHFLRTAIQAFEEFKNYINDPDVLIDHSFMWDIISVPNQKLFKNGINIVILELQEDDVRSKINVICPTNSHQYGYYDKNRPNLILLLQNGAYQPIVNFYRERIMENNIGVKSTSRILHHYKELEHFFSPIFSMVDEKCITRTFSKKQTIKQNISIQKMLPIVKTIYESMVMNHQGKIVGVLVKPSSKKNIYFLPCYPSTLANTRVTVESVWLDDVKWQSFHETYHFLQSMVEWNLLCKPIYSAVENGMVIGIITETNQLVLVDPPIGKEEVADVKLPFLNTGNTIEADSIIGKNSVSNTVEDLSYKNIELEYVFYTNFRTSFRILLSLQKYQPISQKLYNICKSPTTSYSKKRQKVMKHLMTLGEQVFEFSEIDVSTLVVLQESMLNQGVVDFGMPLCLRTQSDDACKVQLPLNHLLSGESNQTIYYIRFADELIRNPRIFQVTFHPEQVQNIKSNNDYQIGENEIILPIRTIRKYLSKLEHYQYGKHGKISTVDDLAKNTGYKMKEVKWVN